MLERKTLTPALNLLVLLFPCPPDPQLVKVARNSDIGARILAAVAPGPEEEEGGEEEDDDNTSDRPWEEWRRQPGPVSLLPGEVTTHLRLWPRHWASLR